MLGEVSLEYLSFICVFWIPLGLKSTQSHSTEHMHRVKQPLVTNSFYRLLDGDKGFLVNNSAKLPTCTLSHRGLLSSRDRNPNKTKGRKNRPGSYLICATYVIACNRF